MFTTNGKQYANTAINRNYVNKYNFTGKCPEPELNQRHVDFQSTALPTELSGQERGVARTNKILIDSFWKINSPELYLMVV